MNKLVPVNHKNDVFEAIQQVKTFENFAQLLKIVRDRLMIHDYQGAEILFTLILSQYREALSHLQYHLHNAALHAIELCQVESEAYNTLAAANQVASPTIKILLAAVEELSQTDLQRLITIAHGLRWSEDTRHTIELIEQDFRRAGQ